MRTVCHLEIKEKYLPSRISGLRLSSMKSMSATIYLRVITAQAQLVDRNSLLSSKV